MENEVPEHGGTYFPQSCIEERAKREKEEEAVDVLVAGEIKVHHNKESRYSFLYVRA